MEKGKIRDEKTARELYQIADSDPSVVDELISVDFVSRRLWPEFNEKSSDEHYLLLDILISRNWARVEKLLTADVEKTQLLIDHSLQLALDEKSSDAVVSNCIEFISVLFSNLQNKVVRKLVGPLVSIAVWKNISEQLRDDILQSNEALMKPWRSALKKYRNSKSFKQDWIFNLSERVLDSECSDNLLLTYADFVLKCISQLPTRRYLLTLFKNQNVLARMAIGKNEIADKCDVVRFYMNFPCDEFTGEPLSEKESYDRYADRIHKMQNLANNEKYRDKLEVLALADFDSVFENIEEHFLLLSDEELQEFAKELHIINKSYSRAVLIQCLKEWCTWSSYDLSSSYLNYNDARSPLALELITSHKKTSSIPICMLGNQYLSLNDYWYRHYCSQSLRFLAFIRENIDQAIAESSENLIEIPESAVRKLPSTGFRDETLQAEISLKVSSDWRHNIKKETSTLLGLIISSNGVQKITHINLIDVIEEHRKSRDSDSEDEQELHTKKRRKLQSLKLIVGFEKSATNVSEELIHITHLIRIDNCENYLLESLKRASVSENSVPFWSVDQFLGFDGIATSADDKAVIYTDEISLSAEQLKSSFGFDVEESGPYDLTLSSKGELVSALPHKRESHKGLSKREFSDEEVRVLLSCLIPGLTILDISRGSIPEKIPFLSHLFHLLMVNSDSKTLVVSKSADIFQRATSSDNTLMDPCSYLIAGTSSMKKIYETRDSLLKIVQNMAEILKVPGDFGESCVSALSFYKAHIKPFLKNPQSEIFGILEKSFVANGYRYSLSEVFSTLEKLLPLEILNEKESLRYLINENLVKTIYTTSQNLLENLRLFKSAKYENLVVLESDEIPEYVTSLAMQSTLKRIILVGDTSHVQKEETALYSLPLDNLRSERSLLARLVVLKFDRIYSLTDSSLYRPELKDGGSYAERDSNAGFLFTKQFIELSESAEKPENGTFHNPVEADYIVCLYQYMRLLGYPREDITISSPLICQCQKIRILLKKLCEKNELNEKIFGMPKVCLSKEVPDSKYVLVSLVRQSTTILNDPLPQAQLGLYIIGNDSTFWETDSWVKTHLGVVPGELYGKPALKKRNGVSIEGYDHLNQYVREMTQQRYNYEKTRGEKRG